MDEVTANSQKNDERKDPTENSTKEVIKDDSEFASNTKPTDLKAVSKVKLIDDSENVTELSVQETKPEISDSETAVTEAKDLNVLEINLDQPKVPQSQGLELPTQTPIAPKNSEINTLNLDLEALDVHKLQVEGDESKFYSNLTLDLDNLGEKETPVVEPVPFVEDILLSKVPDQTSDQCEPVLFKSEQNTYEDEVFDFHPESHQSLNESLPAEPLSSLGISESEKEPVLFKEMENQQEAISKPVLADLGSGESLGDDFSKDLAVGTHDANFNQTLIEPSQNNSEAEAFETDKFKDSNKDGADSASPSFFDNEKTAVTQSADFNFFSGQTSAGPTADDSLNFFDQIASNQPESAFFDSFAAPEPKSAHQDPFQSNYLGQEATAEYNQGQGLSENSSYLTPQVEYSYNQYDGPKSIHDANTPYNYSVPDTNASGYAYDPSISDSNAQHVANETAAYPDGQYGYDTQGYYDQYAYSNGIDPNVGSNYQNEYNQYNEGYGGDQYQDGQYSAHYQQASGYSPYEQPTTNYSAQGQVATQVPGYDANYTQAYGTVENTDYSYSQQPYYDNAQIADSQEAVQPSSYNGYDYAEAPYTDQPAYSDQENNELQNGAGYYNYYQDPNNPYVQPTINYGEAGNAYPPYQDIYAKQSDFSQSATANDVDFFANGGGELPPTEQPVEQVENIQPNSTEPASINVTGDTAAEGAEAFFDEVNQVAKVNSTTPPQSNFYLGSGTHSDKNSVAYNGDPNVQIYPGTESYFPNGNATAYQEAGMATSYSPYTSLKAADFPPVSHTHSQADTTKALYSGSDSYQNESAFLQPDLVSPRSELEINDPVNQFGFPATGTEPELDDLVLGGQPATLPDSYPLKQNFEDQQSYFPPPIGNEQLQPPTSENGKQRPPTSGSRQYHPPTPGTDNHQSAPLYSYPGSIQQTVSPRSEEYASTDMYRQPSDESRHGRGPCALFHFGFGGHVVYMVPQVSERFTSDADTKVTKVYASNIKIEALKEFSNVTDPFRDALLSKPLLNGGADKALIKKLIDANIAQAKSLDLVSGMPKVGSEDEKLLWQLMDILLTNNGSLEGSNEAIVNLLTEALPTGYFNSSEASPLMDIPRIDITVQIRELLLKGNRQRAAKLAMDNANWGHALIIASCAGKEVWQEVVQSFVRHEVLNNQSDCYHSTGLLYSLFAGMGTNALREFTPLEGAADSPLWKEKAAMIFANRTPGDVAVLVALGDELMVAGKVTAAHICYLLAPTAATQDGLSTPNLRLTLLNSTLPTSRGVDLEAVSTTEIYEAILSSSKEKATNPGFAYFQAYKLHKAWCLAEFGYMDQAFKYLESIKSIVEQLPKNVPYLHNTFRVVLESLMQRVSNADGVTKSNSNWLTQKPTIRSVSSFMNDTINQLVLGSESYNESNIEKPTLEIRAGPTVVRNGSFSQHVSNPFSMEDSPARRSSSNDLFSHNFRSNLLDDDMSGRRSAEPNLMTSPFAHSSANLVTSPFQPMNESLTLTPGFEGNSNYFSPLTGAPMLPTTPVVPNGVSNHPVPDEDFEDDLGFGNVSKSRTQVKPNASLNPGGGKASSVTTSPPDGGSKATPTPTNTPTNPANPPEHGRSKSLFSGFFGLFGGATQATTPDGKKIHTAKLGEENQFYFDKELKRWVNKSAPTPTPATALPPPPKARPNPLPTTNHLEPHLPPPSGPSSSSLVPPPDFTINPLSSPVSTLVSPLPSGPPSAASTPSIGSNRNSKKKGAKSRYVDIFSTPQ